MNTATNTIPREEIRRQLDLCRDIARLLNISESTVATRAARGRERLRAALKKEGYDL